MRLNNKLRPYIYAAKSSFGLCNINYYFKLKMYFFYSVDLKANSSLGIDNQLGQLLSQQL